MITVVPGQLDLFADLDAREVVVEAVPSLYGSPARGLVARAAEAAAWRACHGTWGSFGRSPAWEARITCPDTPTDRCQPTVLSADLRCDCFDDCCCVGDLMYRGAYRGCDWEGEPRDEENAALEDACDHAWPGWRELPVAPRMPDNQQRRAAWAERVAASYPANWLTEGRPDPHPARAGSRAVRRLRPGRRRVTAPRGVDGPPPGLSRCHRTTVHAGHGVLL